MGSDVPEVNMVFELLQGDSHSHGDGDLLDRRFFLFEGLHDFVPERRVKFVLEKEPQFSLHDPPEIWRETLVLPQKAFGIDELQWERSRFS